MPLLNGAIPPQSFELIRNRIGEILADEIPNQASLIGNTDLDAKVWVERFIPFDKTDLPAINISLAKGNLQSHDVKSTEGMYLFNIDVHGNAASSPNSDGDKKAIITLHRTLGICRAILGNPIYKTLLFIPPFIMNRHVSDLIIAEPNDKDALSTVMGRLIFSVRVFESVELINAAMIANHTSKVKMSLTDNGYRYIMD